VENWFQRFAFNQWVSLCRYVVDLLNELHNTGGNETVDIDKVNMVSKLKFTVRVGRTTRFYMLNYVLIVTTLTAMSWVVFVLPPTQLSNRCTISLTLILALNVFQLIINDSTPKTNYLSPMHEFIISSTFFVVLTALESVAVHVAHRRVALKSAVIRNFMKSTYSDERQSAGFVKWMTKLASIRRRRRAVPTSPGGGVVNKAGAAGAAGADLDDRLAVPASGYGPKMVRGASGDPSIMVVRSSSSYSVGMMGDAHVRELHAVREDDGGKNGGGGGDGDGGGGKISSIPEDEDEDGEDGNDPVAWDDPARPVHPGGGNGDASPRHPPSRRPKVGVMDRVEAFVTMRLDSLSSILFPAAYVMDMLYIFAMDHDRK
jgi:hypothetical protein